MPRLSGIWQTRLILVGLILLSLVPVNLQRLLNVSEIYDIRVLGGLHPSDLLMLRDIGQRSFICPAIFFGLLLLSPSAQILLSAVRSLRSPSHFFCFT